MLTIHRLNATKKPPVGTPGSSAWQQGFDVQITTMPKMEAYCVAIVWTEGRLMLFGLWKKLGGNREKCDWRLRCGESTT